MTEAGARIDGDGGEGQTGIAGGPATAAPAPVSDATVPDGTVSGGTVSDGAVSDGTVAPVPLSERGNPAIRRAVRTVLAAAVLIGVLQGVLWAFTAPGIPYQVLADGRFGALPTTSTYHFVDAAIFALSGIALGVLLAVGAWQARAARGWQVLLALVAGSLLGALIAWLLGEWIAPGTDPASVGASDAGSIVVAAPATGTILVVLAQPAFAAIVYTFLVAWNGHPDLGRAAAR